MGLLAAASVAHAAGSLLRISCEGDAAGAEISVNDDFKGECPIDVKVPAGTVKLFAKRSVDADHERVLEQEMRIGDEVVKTVELVLPPARLSADAQHRADTAAAAARARREEAALRDRALLASQQQAAEQGDLGAMEALADRYDTGVGVPRDDKLAQQWWNKAIAGGSLTAKFHDSGLYRRLAPEDRAAALRVFSLPADPARQVNVEGNDRIRAFVEHDPFFAVPGGSAPATTTHELTFTSQTIPATRIDNTCQRHGQLFEQKGSTQNPLYSSTYTGVDALGGVVPLKTRGGRGWFDVYTQEMERLLSVTGEPFVADQGKRWGLRYVINHDDKYHIEYTMTCASTTTAGNLPGAHGNVALVCVRESFTRPDLGGLLRLGFDDLSGCMVTPAKVPAGF